MLETKNLTILISNKYYVKDLTFSLNKGDKLAIIGEEGNGKSTLLKVLAGHCNYAEVSGEIYTHHHKIGYLPQQIEVELEQTGYEFIFATENDYYNKINLLYKKLKELNLNENLLNQKITQLSGGEKVKIGILKLLLEENEILLLDEPTNDLDLETLHWLENFILNTNNPIIYVSHDETLLSKTANIILHIEQIKKKTECKYTLEKMDYDTYVETRLQKIKAQTRIAENEKREYDKKEAKLNQIKQKVDYQLNTISRSNPHGAKLLKKKCKVSNHKKSD